MKITRYLVAALPVAMIVLLSACGGGGKGASDSANAKKDSLANKAVHYDRKFNDFARYIAGLKLSAGHGLGEVEKDSLSAKHAATLDTRWAEMETNRLSKMRSFADTELYKRIDRKANLYYPLSGADFLHANQFFPDAKKSLYIALEPVGEVPDITGMKDKQRHRYLRSIEATLSDIFRRSYFITSRMGNDIPQVKGVIPVFLVFMVRSGYDIQNVELIEINSKGQSVARTAEKGPIQGVRISYSPAGKPTDLRTLEYFSCDASNTGTKAHPELLTHIRDFGKANVFFKAASYIMHNPGFTEFRDASLDICLAVVQDDTGFPYRVLKDNFTGYLYGTYVPPISDFGKGGYQADLAKAYKESASVKKLPFSLGYHWYDKNQNYMCFVKKK